MGREVLSCMPDISDIPGKPFGCAKLFSDGGVEAAETASTSYFILHEHLGILIVLGHWVSVGVWRRAAEVVPK